MNDLIFDQFIDVSLGETFCHAVHAAIPYDLPYDFFSNPKFQIRSNYNVSKLLQSAINAKENLEITFK